MPATALEAARAYLAAGLSVIPIRGDGTKEPDLPAGDSVLNRKRLATDEELAAWLSGGFRGVAVLGGPISGGLEVIDFDRADRFAPWCAAVETKTPGLVARLTVNRTPGGWHVAYRCPGNVEGNLKLAREPDPTAPPDKPKPRVLIETRGDGGYVLAPGCPACCHDTGKLYVHHAGPSLANVQTVSADERDILIDCAVHFNTWTPPERSAPQRAPSEATGDRPGDLFNARGSWEEAFGDSGWRYYRPSGATFGWTRPGKDRGVSATTGVRSECGKDLLVVFSTNAYPLEADESYSKFAAFTLLNHGGDYSAAARALILMGYGTPSLPAGRILRSATPEPPPWEPPLPLDRLAPPVHFPLEAFPAPLSEYVQQCAWATNSPEDFVAVPVLALAAGCIGASSVVGITSNHIQPSTLFAVVVGLPGTGKSPALESVLHPLEEAEREYHRQWKADMRAWRAEDPKERGPKPVLRRVVVDDTTSEALMRTLHTNQRGVVMVRDELSALIAGFNQYKGGGKGNDRQVYLKTWSAATIRVDRKAHEDDAPLIIHRPSLSVVGGVQPDVVKSFLNSDEEGKVIDDGLLDRFLFSYPRDLPAVEERFREVDAEKTAVWDRIVRWLLSLKQWPGDFGPRPKVVKLSSTGREAWVSFTRSHAAELNDPDFPDWRRGPWSKLRGYCARLSLVLHLLRMATDAGAMYDEVDAESVQKAWRLIDYFKAHYLRVATRMGADPRIADASLVLGWLKRNPKVIEFSRRDAYCVLSSSFSTPDALEGPMRLLVQYGYLRPVHVQPAATGRKPGPRWEVNPGWTRV